MSVVWVIAAVSNGTNCSCSFGCTLRWFLFEPTLHCKIVFVQTANIDNVFCSLMPFLGMLWMFWSLKSGWCVVMSVSFWHGFRHHSWHCREILPTRKKLWYMYHIFLNTSRLWINAGSQTNAGAWQNGTSPVLHVYSHTFVPVALPAEAEATPNSSSDTSCCSFNRRVHNVELVGICITWYFFKFVVIFDLQCAVYTKRTTDVALTRLRLLYIGV